MVTVSLDCGRKPQYLEKTYANTKNICTPWRTASSLKPVTFWTLGCRPSVECSHRPIGPSRRTWILCINTHLKPRWHPFPCPDPLSLYLISLLLFSFCLSGAFPGDRSERLPGEGPAGGVPHQGQQGPGGVPAGHGARPRQPHRRAGRHLAQPLQEVSAGGPHVGSLDSVSESLLFSMDPQNGQQSTCLAKSTTSWLV